MDKDGVLIMDKQLIDSTAARLNVHPLIAIRYLVTGTTANCMFNRETTRRIAQAWKAYQA